MICTRCTEDKPVDDFSFQKSKPIFRYAWCDPCRYEANRAAKNESDTLRYKRNKEVAAEYQAMRDKAISMRKFSPDQCKSIKTRVEGGEKVVDLALEYKVGQTTIRKAMRNYL